MPGADPDYLFLVEDVLGIGIQKPRLPTSDLMRAAGA